MTASKEPAVIFSIKFARPNEPGELYAADWSHTVENRWTLTMLEGVSWRALGELDDAAKEAILKKFGLNARKHRKLIRTLAPRVEIVNPVELIRLRRELEYSDNLKRLEVFSDNIYAVAGQKEKKFSAEEYS